MFARKRRKKWPIVLAVLLALLSLLAAAAWYVGRTLELQLQITGELNVTQEYGSSNQEPGVKVLLKSVLFPPLALDIPVTVTGQVDSNTVGAYAVAYHARLFWLEDTALRVVEIVDSQPPVITLTEIEGDFTLPGSEYKEVGFSAGVFILAVFSNSTEIVALLMLLPLMKYDGTRGKSLKYVFYVFYPVHLLILALICMSLGV